VLSGSYNAELLLQHLLLRSIEFGANERIHELESRGLTWRLDYAVDFCECRILSGKDVIAALYSDGRSATTGQLLIGATSCIDWNKYPKL
jgi:hypothetical protein